MTDTNTIEVPIELIKSGDIDAIRELLPKENLFGRWATHPQLGRGIIISTHPALDNTIWFARETPNNGKTWVCIYPDDITLDPVELTTLEDFENAPEGTIVSDSYTNAFQKTDAYNWESVNDMLTHKQMAASGPWTILRHGWEE